MLSADPARRNAPLHEPVAAGATWSYAADVATCAACGEANDDRAKFCSACGAALRQSAKPREERRLVSVLFVDLVGHTARSDQADPEDVRDLLSTYHAGVKEQIERFGGTVEKFIGDAVMAVFGAPHAFGDDAERAVRAGLRAIEAVDTIQVGGVRGTLSARAAVATGEAVVNVDDGRSAGEALAMGDVVNTASRLQAAAPVGGVVADAPTFQATRRSVRFEPLEPVVAKGKSAPLPVWQAMEVAASPGDRQPGGAPMVGRDHEVSLLRSTWNRSAEQRRPHFAMVVGVAGAGKSRLLREFGNWVTEQGGQVVRGRCLPYEQADVYGAFTQQLKQLAGIDDTDSASDATAKVEQLVLDVVPEAERSDVMRSCSVLFEPEPDAVLFMEPDLLLYGFRRLVEAVSSRRPTLWVFEDIHWADAGEFALIRYLATHVRDVPAMLVGAARPELVETRPDWNAGLLAATAIVLEPLGDGDAAAVVAALAGARLDLGEVQRLVETAEGNPLFLEELVGAVLEGAGTGGLPTSVLGAIASRIDVLPPSARSLLLAASVIGRHFWVGPLRDLQGSEDVAAVLDVLEAKDFVRRQPTSAVRGEIEYLFRHVLIRDVCYGTLTRSERADAHGRVAAYLEAKVGDDRDFAWLLAHHWEQAGQPSRAVPHLLVAAERAKSALAESEALALLDRAERLAPDEATTTKVRLARGLALAWLERYDDAQEALQTLLPTLDGVDLVDGLIAYARSCHWTERTEEVIRAAQLALDTASTKGLHDYVGPALARLSQGYAMRGDDSDLPTAIELGERALQEWVDGTQTEERAEHEHLLADQYLWVGDYSRAYDLAVAARDRAVDPASAEARLRGGGMHALLLASLGRYEESLARADEMIALGREMGRGVRVLLNYSTLAYRELYDLDEARQRSETALDGMLRTSFHMPWMNAEADLAHVDLLAREYGAALTRWEALWEPVLATTAWERWLLGGKLAAFRAEIALHTETLDSALDWATRAVEMARTSRRVKYDVVARTTLGSALLRAGRSDDAVRELTAAADAADGLGNPAGRWPAHAGLAAALYRSGDDTGAERHHRIASDVVDEVAAGLSPERAEKFLAAVPLPQPSEYH